MSDSGLTNRLRQHSRRSGLGVGLTMAAAIAICILAAAWIFGQLEPYVGDIAGYDEPTATSVPAVAAVATGNETASSSTDNPASTQVPAERSNQSRNQPLLLPRRSHPLQQPCLKRRIDRIPISRLIFGRDPAFRQEIPFHHCHLATPLKFLDEQALDEEGSIWLKMETETGTQGWLREVDTQVIIT